MDLQFELAEIGLEVRKHLEQKSIPLMEKYGLRKVDLDVLYCLNKYSQVYDMAHDLLNKLHISKAHISKSVDNLNRHGFLCLKEDEKDHRCVHLSLSKKGCDVASEYSQIKKDFANHLFSTINEEEHACLKNVISKIKVNVQNDNKFPVKE